MAEEVPPQGAWHDFKSLHFKLFYYKVLPCTKAWSHDWQHCPFTHPNDKARRRSPLHCSYSADMCPAVLQNGSCPKGANCNMAHNLFEYHLHPDRYKTKMCRDGAHCNRIFCFFAHSQDELRTPFSATAKPPGSTACAAAAAAAGHGFVGSSNSSSCSTATNTPMNQPATPSVSGSPAAAAAAGMYGSAQQQQLMGAACRTSFDQQQQQVLLPAAVGLAGNGTAMQVPATGYNSNISGGSCILLAPAGSNSYSQQQLQLQQPGTAMGGMFSACQPINAGMLMNSGFGDSLPQQQQQQVFAASWQQAASAPSFVSADSSMVGSMAQPLLVNTQQQLQQLRLVPQMQCNAAVGSPVSGMTVGSQAQLMNWPTSAAAAAGGGGGLTSSPLGVSSAIGNFDMQYMQQQPAGGMMLQPASMAVAMDAAATGQQLQLVMQPGSQTGAASVMVGQQHAVLVPITVMASAAGTATVQQQGVQLPQQQQQALLVPLSSSAAAATAAAASQTHMVVPQWSM